MSPFPKPKSFPPGADWGYRKRTGRKGDYRYWYEETVSKKIYQGRQPSEYWIKQKPKNIKHPSKGIITENPWHNYYSTLNTEKTETESHVLINYFGITDITEVELHEDVGYGSTVHDILKIINMDERLNKERIREIHHNIFWRLYTWAGKYRTVDLAKPGFRWPPHQYIPKEMETFENDILSVLTPARFHLDERMFGDAAQVMGDFLMIHPFRDGNGRVSKILGAILLLQAGYPLMNLEKIKKTELISASLNAYGKNYDELRDLLKAATLTS